MTDKLIKFEDIKLKRYNIFTSECTHLSLKESVVYYPETNLFPSKQQERIKNIIFNFNKVHGKELILFTNSPFVACMLNNLLFAYSIRDKQTIYEPDMLINPAETNVYHINADGMCRDMWDDDHELFICEEMENVPSMEEFTKLLDLKYDNKEEDNINDTN